MSGQSVRPSQFITNYGPGALLETPEGPSVMADFHHCGIFADPSGRSPPIVRDITDYEITDQRLSNALLGGARIFAIPTNDDLNVPGTKGLYRSFAFPQWSLCVSPAHRANVNVIYRLKYDGTKTKLTGCPECGPLPRSDAWQKARREAITFVRACPAGHLDDILWPATIKHKDDCNGQSFDWIGTGSSLANIDIVCRDCRESENMRTIFTSPWPCSGRFPETGSYRGESCTNRSTVLLKGAANLRIPEIVSALTIPPNDTPVHRILGRSKFQSALAGASALGNVNSKVAILKIAKATPSLLRANEAAVLEEATEDELLGALEDLRNANSELSPHEMKVDEFHKLKTASEHGAPPMAAKHPSMPHWFEVVKKDIVDVERPNKTTIRITPVNRLRVVMVQLGYTRPVGEDEPELVKRTYHDEVDTWYPGVELSGEGIFLSMPSGAVQPVGKHAEEWYAQWKQTGEPQHHPVFVWWHSYAHRLLSSLSVDSGYASASIRERVFVEIDESTGRADGGVLLYTSQPGGDGTLGGLVALTADFNRILAGAEAYVDSCSNDPICEETAYKRGHSNGAACYACLMASETSCEHRNMSLDRNLLRENMP